MYLLQILDSWSQKWYDLIIFALCSLSNSSCCQLSNNSGMSCVKFWYSRDTVDYLEYILVHTQGQKMIWHSDKNIRLYLHGANIHTKMSLGVGFLLATISAWKDECWAWDLNETGELLLKEICSYDDKWCLHTFITFKCCIPLLGPTIKMSNPTALLK